MYNTQQKQECPVPLTLPHLRGACHEWKEEEQAFFCIIKGDWPLHLKGNCQTDPPDWIPFLMKIPLFGKDDDPRGRRTPSDFGLIHLLGYSGSCQIAAGMQNANMIFE